jgi:hypothetical protein
MHAKHTRCQLRQIPEMTLMRPLHSRKVEILTLALPGEYSLVQTMVKDNSWERQIAIAGRRYLRQ